MSEYDAIDAMLERAVREEQDDADRAHGEAILDAVAASEARRQEDPLLKALNQAHQAKAEDDKQ
jgi:hypothetical protein